MLKIISNKNVLIISPEAWGKSSISKHHYAIQLAALGNRVFFLEPPQTHSFAVTNIEEQGITLIKDNYSIKGIRFYPTWLRKRLFLKMARKLAKDHQVNFDIVWSFDNSRFFDLSCFEHAIKIHHMMDYHVDYNCKIASESADICLGVSDDITKKLLRYNQRSFTIQHGYSEHTSERKPLPIRPEKFKAFYAGNLLMIYVNWIWLHALIKNNPDTHFYFAGSYDVGNLNPQLNKKTRMEVDKIAKNENVTLLGEITSSEIHGYLQDADILFFAYRSEEFPEILSNSHKIMAYLGSGKPIISHNIRAYENTDSLIYMVKTLEDYLRMFDTVKSNLNHYTNDILTKKRKAWALDNTYEKQIQRIDSLISK